MRERLHSAPRPQAPISGGALAPAPRSSHPAPAASPAAPAPAPAFDFGAVDVVPAASGAMRSRPLRGGADGGCAAGVPAAVEAALAAERARAPRLGDVAPDAAPPERRHDLAAVRIHAGPAAEAMARSVGARAFTLGADVVFGARAFAPHTDAGRALLRHELGHVGAAVGPSVALRAPLRYDATGFTITPPTKPFSLKDAQDLVDARKTASPADLTSGAVKGATAGSDAEIFLWYLLSAVGKRERWGTEVDMIAPIGWPAKPGDPTPFGKVTVTIDDTGNGVAELLSAGAVTAPTTYATRADAEKELKATYGIAAVTDDSATWSVEELNKVIGAFALLPAADRAALSGVELIRVTSLGGTTAGQFESSQSASGTTATVAATLKLADRAFAGDAVSFVGGGTAASPASYQTIVHEVGHAIATKARRDAGAAHMRAIAATNQLILDFNAAVGVTNDALTEFNDAVTEFNDAVPAYNDAVKAGDKAGAAAAKKVLDDKKKVVDEKKKAWDAAKKDEAAKKKAKETGEKDVTAKKTASEATMMPAKALASLKTDAETKQKAAATALAAAATAAGAYSPDDASASQSYRDTTAAVGTAIDDLMKGAGDASVDLDTLSDAAQSQVDAQGTARDALKAAAPANPALSAFAPVETAQASALAAARLYAYATHRTARVHAFVTFVTAQGIAPFTKYAKDNWPHKPEEFYAEAYSLWRTDPAFLKTNYPKLSAWFDGGKYK